MPHWKLVSYECKKSYMKVDTSGKCCLPVGLSTSIPLYPPRMLLDRGVRFRPCRHGGDTAAKQNAQLCQPLTKQPSVCHLSA